MSFSVQEESRLREVLLCCARLPLQWCTLLVWMLTLKTSPRLVSRWEPSREMFERNVMAARRLRDCWRFAITAAIRGPSWHRKLPWSWFGFVYKVKLSIEKLASSKEVYLCGCILQSRRLFMSSDKVSDWLTVSTMMIPNTRVYLSNWLFLNM